MNNILIIGSNGQVGSEFKNIYTNHNLYLTDKTTLDVTQYEDVYNFCQKNNITHIVNCSAYTNVENAQIEIDMADVLNNIAVKNLALIAKKLSISLIHISTDYVFDGCNYKPYAENDKPNPLNIYGKTKLNGEHAMLEVNPAKSIIIRTSWVYSSFKNNFVKTMLKLSKNNDNLKVIYDQVGTPTYSFDIANTVMKTIDKLTNKDVEIYHYSNEGVTSWYDFAKEIFSLSKKDTNVLPIPSSEYQTKAKRPYYSVLDKSKIKKDFNLDIPYWKDSLEKCLKIIGENDEK